MIISVGSGGGRKRLGSGLEMEEAELEEGEALSYQDEGEDSTIDPDIALSYIGEKLQNVLGHFQKDFEGGVSAENLGAKFGGYGSFLPTHQRSPSWSHTKSPAEGHNYDSPKSPKKQLGEDQRRNSIASSSAYPSVKSRAPSGNTALVENSLKDSRVQSKHAEESNSKSAAIKKPVNSSDQRTLKVRIKVGSDNLSTQKNAKIYSGLGLEVSPSSSLDDSPTTSEGQGAKVLCVPEESPTSILKIMASFPRELLLSPLSEDVIHLTEKRKNSENKPLKNVSIECSEELGNGYTFSRSNQKMLEVKKLKPYGRDDAFSMDMPIQKSNGDKDYKVAMLKKEENEIDSLGCEELVSNALKLPLLSGKHTACDPAKDEPTASNFTLNALNNGVKGEARSTFMEEEPLDSKPVHGLGKFEKLGGVPASSGKVSESKKGKISNLAAFPQADESLEEKSHNLDQPESYMSKGRKGLRATGTPEPSKEFLKGAAGSVERPHQTSEKSSVGGKRKHKLAGSAPGSYMVKDEPMVESSLTHSGGKNSHSSSLIPKNDSYDLQKVHEKPGDRYKDFFGDIEFENDDNESISGEMTSSGGLKNPDFIAKTGLSKHNTLKEKRNDDNSEKPHPPDTCPRPAAHLNPLHENGTSIDPPTGPVPLVKEDWVSCDKCHKWRLLPLGTNPNSLPHKWICRMLNWLPGMNRCSIPEEETTNALMALNNPTAPIPSRASESQHMRLDDSVGTSVAIASVDDRHSDYEHQNVAAQTMTLDGKKKHGSSKASDSTDLDGSTKSSNLKKKNLSTPGKTSNLSSKSHSPSLDTRGYQHMAQSGAVEKYSDAKKERPSLVNYVGQDPNLKIRSKKEGDLDGSRASKRIKSEELPFDDDNWTSDNGRPSSKAGRGSSSLSNNTSDNDRYRCSNRKDLSDKAKNTTLAMDAEKHVPGTSTDNILHCGKSERESVRKRKGKEPHGSQIHTEPVSKSGRCRPDSGDFTDEMFENDHRKEKKARVSKSGGKDASVSKTSIGSDRKSKGNKVQYKGQYLSNNQVADYLKNDIGPVQPLVAANSSSSKVSGSHKNKTSGQEIKGSPVESVSSSPLRFPTADRVTSSRKNPDRKDDFHDSGSLSAASPKRLSGGEDGGHDRSGTGKNHVTEVYNDNMCQGNQYGSVRHYSEQREAEEKTNLDQSQNSGFHAKKSGKWVTKDKIHTSGLGLDKANAKALDSTHDSLDKAHLYEKSKSRRSKSDEKSGNTNKGEKFIAKKDATERAPGEKGQSQKKFGHDGPDAMKSQDKKQEHDHEKLPRKSSHADAYQGEKSHSLPPTVKVQSEAVATLRPGTGSQKENGLKTVGVDAFDNGDTMKEPNQRKRAENPNGKPIRHPTPNSHKVRDVDAPSPLRRDSSSNAANSALKEAKDLKHLADRLKNSGSNESIGYYFQAALKFLHGASLLESGSSDAPKHNELAHAMHIYSSTAKLCEFCAHEYEKLKDMAAAALAYKCVEVAYMRVVYSSHTSASRDRNELQNTLQIAPAGESPSSSASDVENLNHQTTTDKAALPKVISSPQVSGNHSMPSRNRSGFLRILNFAQDVNFAMEASRKSRSAFTAATSKLGETSQGDGISSLKKALDFNFQDVESLLRLVRVAMEAIVR